MLKMMEVVAGRVGRDDSWLLEDFTASVEKCFSDFVATVSFSFSEAADTLAMASTGEEGATEGPCIFMEALASKSCTRQETLVDGILMVHVGSGIVALGGMLALRMAC